MIGTGPASHRLRDAIAGLAATDVNVLVRGETGTGKGMVARAIHDQSRRRNEPFVAVNCAALPAALLESELFGHVRGAFTDAKRSHDGLFVHAGDGTIFLDEIGDMPLEMQAKLLRVLEERVVRPVGSSVEVPFGARVITATHRDLERAIAAGTFRHDLYYRVNVVEVSVPPLRDRREDVVPLARHFAAALARQEGRAPRALDEDVTACLVEYAWPGNIRELENCVQRMHALAAGAVVGVDDLPPAVRRCLPARRAVQDRAGHVELATLREIQRRHIEAVMSALAGNRTKAARVLGVHRRSLYRMIDRLGVVDRRTDRRP